MATPKKFAVQQVYDILLRNPVDKKIIGYIEDAKTTNFNNTVEMVYPMGGAGNVYVGGAFAHSRRATLEVTNAVWNIELMAAQNGTEIITEDNLITKFEVLELPSAEETNTRTLSHTPVGATGAQVGYAYEVNEDGTMGKAYTQSTTAGEGTFSLSGTTMTFSNLGDDVKIAVVYQYQATDAARIEVNTDSIPDMALVTCYGVAKDQCNGKLYPCQINGLAQIDGNNNFELQADGEVSVQNLNLEFVKTCGTKKLYDFTVYAEE